MRQVQRRLKIGIVGCGAIGGGIARYIQKRLKKDCQLTGLYDIEYKKAERLRRELGLRGVEKSSLKSLIQHCDLMIEAVNSPSTRPIIHQALMHRRDVIAMSVGKLLHASDLFRLARKHHCHLLLPSGAVAGIDAIKAAALGRIYQIRLITRKPLESFLYNPYLKEQGFDLARIKDETILFDGDVATCVKFFPQNINVAATIALASGAQDKMRVRIMTSPDYKNNSHEIQVIGDFGEITTLTENIVCPENPKTSYLAVLSAIQTLRQFCQRTYIGT